MRNHVYFLLKMTILVALNQRTRSVDYHLFRASQGGDGIKPAGLWGGFINILNQGMADNLFEYGYPSQPTNAYLDFTITSIAHDPIRKDGFVLLEHSDHVTFALARGPLCQEGAADLHFILRGARLIDNENPYLLDSACDWKCGINSVAVHNGTIYFVFSAVYGKVFAQLQREIQIRALGGCEHLYGASISQFHVLNCSRLVRTLYSHKYEWPTPTLNIWPASDLKLLPSSPGSAQFVLQVFDSLSAAKELNVYYAREGGTVAKVFTEVVDSAYASKSRIRGLGAVDYMGNILCWTAGDRLLCSTYMDGQLFDPFTVLSPGDAVEGGVCTGSLPSEALERTLTGLAIAEIGDSLTIFFSCYAEIPGVGGVGQVRQMNHGLVKTVYPVFSGARRVYGGALFLTEDVGGETCNVNGGESPPSSAASSTFTWSTLSLPPQSADKPDNPGKPIVSTDRAHSTQSAIVGNAARIYPNKFAVATFMFSLSTVLLVLQALWHVVL